MPEEHICALVIDSQACRLLQEETDRVTDKVDVFSFAVVRPLVYGPSSSDSPAVPHAHLQLVVASPMDFQAVRQQMAVSLHPPTQVLRACQAS